MEWRSLPGNSFATRLAGQMNDAAGCLVLMRTHPQEFPSRNASWTRNGPERAEGAHCPALVKSVFEHSVLYTQSSYVTLWTS
jgi:hypothetical protein